MTVGFADVDDPECAVCLQPGTELSFDKELRVGSWIFGLSTPFTTAIFRQKDMEKDYVHHDVLEFPDGRKCLLTMVQTGVVATVLQLPVEPKNEIVDLRKLEEAIRA